MIQSKSQKSLPGIVKASLRKLQIATVATLAVSTLANLAIFVGHFGESVCASIESSYRLRSGALARELSLGGKSTAAAIFEEFASSLKTSGTFVDLKLSLPGPLSDLSLCRPGLIYASVEIPVQFAGDTFAVIRGRVGDFSILYFCGGMFGLFLLLGYLTRSMNRVLTKKLLSEVIEPIRRIASGQDVVTDALPAEVAQIQDSIFAMKDELREKEAQNHRLLWTKRVAEFAEQVSHDIKSPLATLELSMKDFGDVSTEQKVLMFNSVTRIQEILNSLEDGRHAKIPAEFRSKAVEARPESIGPLLEQIVSEKRLQFACSGSLKLIYIASEEASRTECFIVRNEFSRAISNIVTNAAEALIRGRGEVAVSLTKDHDRVRVEIRDNGCGISEDLLARITERGTSFGKRGGTGLGLFQAKSFVDTVGGSLEIRSEVGLGTTVVMQLKTLPHKPCTIVLIDNDPLLRRGWHLKAKGANESLLSFKSVQDFMVASDPIERSVPIYIDSELDDEIPGEVAAERISKLGFENIILATGRAKVDLSQTPWIKGRRGKDYPELLIENT